MTRFLSLLYIFAAGLPAAFLFSQTPTVNFVQGKVEYVVLDGEKGQKIDDLEVNSSVLPNHLIATGKGSRTELHQGNIIWRLGSLSVGKWLSQKRFWLHSGSSLLCTTKETTLRFSSIDSNATFVGKGTIIIEATSNGGFKFIPLECKGTLTTLKGGTKEIIEGQMLLVMGNPTEYGNAFDLDLILLLRSSRLVNSFPVPLPTFDQIGLAIYVQQLKLKGKYDALIGDATTNENLQLWKFGKAKDANPKQSTPKKGFLGRFFGSD